MTVELLDSFNRTGANLGSNPSGRWNIPVGDFTLNGQVAATDSTIVLSTSPWAHFYAPAVGSKYGESRVSAIRGTAQVKAIGVIARASTITIDRARYWFGWTNESGTEKFELRLYSTSTAYTVVGTVNASTLSITGDLAWHTYAIRIVNSTGSLINITCKYDTTTCLVINNVSDPLGVVVPASTQPGFQLTTSSTWASATDYAQFDNCSWDDLATPTVAVAPALTTEAALTPVALSSETDTTASYPHVAPDWGEEIEEDQAANISPRSEAGYRTSFAKYTRGRRRWSVGWSILSAADATDLALHFIASQGGVAYFDYDAPDGVTYTVRFLTSSIPLDAVSSTAFAGVTAVLEEVI